MASQGILGKEHERRHKHLSHPSHSLAEFGHHSPGSITSQVVTPPWRWPPCCAVPIACMCLPAGTAQKATIWFTREKKMPGNSFIAKSRANVFKGSLVRRRGDVHNQELQLLVVSLVKGISVHQQFVLPGKTHAARSLKQGYRVSAWWWGCSS